MPGVKNKATIIGIVMIVGYMLISAIPNNEAQAASCPALPEVAWWETTHDKIVQHVEQHYSGKWDPYIEKWKIYRDKMKNIFDKKGTAVVKSKGVRLKGSTLQNHIIKVDKRILITRCLKRKYSGRLASLNYIGAQDFGFASDGVAVVYQAAKRQAFYLARISSYASKEKSFKSQ